MPDTVSPSAASNGGELLRATPRPEPARYSSAAGTQQCRRTGHLRGRRSVRAKVST